MSVTTAAGTRLYIGGTGDLFSPDPPWVEIAEIVDFGEIGRVYELITHNPVADRQTRKFKGSFNDGSMALQLGRDIEDAGQAALLVALDSDTPHNFRIDLNDVPVGGGFATQIRFKGLVMSFPFGIGSVNSIVSATVNLEVDGEIFVEPAHPA